MLKLTMSPRKRSKRMRSYHSKMRYAMMEIEDRSGDQQEILAGNLQALLRQENSGHYRTVDYLSLTAWDQDIYQLLKRSRYQVRGQQVDSRVDEYCREQIVEWSFRVVDYFRIDREVVALSLSFLDRFLATCRCDRTSFKLAATTTLHLAVKLLYPVKLGDLGILSDLSRGEFDMHDVAEMESHILKTLAWHLHPPTASAFCNLLLDYVFANRSLNLSPADIDDLYDIASFFCELAVCDYFFVTCKASLVAVSSILNALEGMFGHDNDTAGHIVAAAKHLQFDASQDLTDARHRLWELYERSEECALHNNCDPGEEEKVGGSTGAIFVKKNACVSTSPIAVAAKPCKSMPSEEFLCPGRSKSIRNGSW